MPLGRVVRSKCGRDRYRPFVIVGVTEDGRVLLADGRLHKLAAPKKKNLSHVEVLAASVGEVTSPELLGDEGIERALREIEERIAKQTV